MTTHIQWTQLDTGNLMSQGSRFLVTRPECIKAACGAYNDATGTFQREQRVRLVDRLHKPGGLPYMKPEKRVFLCLSVNDAMTLAQDILSGKGVLAV